MDTKELKRYNLGDVFSRKHTAYKVIGFTKSKKSVYVENINNENIKRTCRTNKFFGTPKLKIDGVVYTKNITKTIQERGI